MKQIVSISAVLAVISVAIFGCLYIFGLMSPEAALSNLLKVVAAIALLGGCSALVVFLMGSKKEPTDQQ
jgi:type IV secretory pathway VirB2 component (pilin)